jgi:hypothetical protein
MTARYSVLMVNPDAEAAATFTAGSRRLARAVACRARRREEVVAGVVGHLGGPEVDA